MTLALNRKSVISGIAFLAVLALSMLLFLTFSDKQKAIVLFFPNDSNHRLTGESRFVPRKGTIQGNVQELVDGLILGPEKLRHVRALARSTTIRSLMLRNGTLYLDFSPQILFPEGDTSTGFTESLDAVRKSIKFNFPEIKKIIITVNGSLPKSEIVANT